MQSCLNTQRRKKAAKLHEGVVVIQQNKGGDPDPRGDCPIVIGRQERPTLGGAQPEGLDGKQDGADLRALLARKGENISWGMVRRAQNSGRPAQRSSGGGQPQGAPPGGHRSRGN